MKLPKANSIPDEISFPAGGKIVPDVYQAEVESESGYRSLKPYLDDWSRKDLLPGTGRKSNLLAWYIQCEMAGRECLAQVIDIDPDRRGGVPLLRGTGFTVAQTLAELAESSAVAEVASDFDIDEKLVRDLLYGFSLMTGRSFLK